nr:MAG TPA: Protein transport protein SEC61, Protein, Sec63, Sec71, Sec72, Sec66.68A [Caudoviricetes sp.]
MFIVPFGYIMILAWIIVTISAFVFLRKNKANLLSFLIPWIIGLIGCLIAIKLY